MTLVYTPFFIMSNTYVLSLKIRYEHFLLSQIHSAPTEVIAMTKQPKGIEIPRQLVFTQSVGVFLCCSIPVYSHISMTEKTRRAANIQFKRRS